jgi:hypothetical protein
MTLNKVSRQVPLSLEGTARPGVSDPSSATLTHQAEATRLINEALRQPWRGTSDAIIAAVTILANWQSFVGDLSEAEQCLGGLERLFRMRGGLEALPLPLVQRIQRVDTNVAAASSSRPCFPLLKVQNIDIRRTIPLSKNAQLFNHNLHLLGTGFLRSDVSDLLSQDIQIIFDDMQALAMLFNLWTHGQANSLGLANDFFEMRIVAVENRLLTMPHQESYDCAALVQECCRIAALLFVNTSFWLWQKWNRVLVALVALLGRKVDIAQRMDCWRPPLWEVLMWIIFFGRHAASAQDQADWFSRRLVTVTKNLGIVSWEEARKILMRFFYWDAVHSQPFSDIWDELQMLRTWNDLMNTIADL